MSNSGAHPASYSMGAVGKAAEASTLRASLP